MVNTWKGPCFPIQYQDYDGIIGVYLKKAKILFDELAVVGRPIFLEDFNLHVFWGLKGEIKDLVTNLSSKEKPITYIDFHRYLLIFEFFQKCSL